MKKYLFLMIALIGLVGMSGCKKEEIVNPINSRTIKFDVPGGSNNWGTEDNGLTWYQTLELPELDDAYFDDGYVIVHLSLIDNEYEALPTTINQVAYTYNYGFDDQGGYLRIYCEASDGKHKINPPEDLIYGKLILSDSDPIN
ncbi:hypothetical protein GCM10023231_18980 [Olivibacter ginsenosidimutans]|uniref:Uncharacterized protein n=1 Tax=Olivibacter ginsenosidimutans TaxID=1176537 RepID=A0ABP9B8Z7_9SPHI